MANVRIIPFIYSKTVAYDVELGDNYMRFFYNGAVLTDDSDEEVWIETPYEGTDIFELQYHQVGDVMWIVHEDYAPRKLTRPTATSFRLQQIDFKNGPFMTRNDLINPDNPSSITMAASVTGGSTAEGATGEYSLSGDDPNYITYTWWQGIAANGIDGSQNDYCGGGHNAGGYSYITYTVTYETAISALTDIYIDYVCMSWTQGDDLTANEVTKRGLRVYENGAWTEVIDPDVIDADFPATTYTVPTVNLTGLDEQAVISGTWTNVTKIEVYLWAMTSGHGNIGTAIMNISAGAEDYAEGTLTASDDYFEEGMEGTLFKLIHKRAVNYVELSTIGHSEAIYVKGSFRFNTHGVWTGTVELQRNDNGAGWDTYRTYKSKNDRQIDIAFYEGGDNVQYRIYATGLSGVFSSEITLDDVYREGIVRISTVESATECTIEVIAELENTDATLRWAEGAWSTLRGFPSTVTFFEDRCIYGGMQTILPAEAKLLTEWLSAVGDYENFDEGIKDAESFAVTIPSTNDLMWTESLESLLVGTASDEWRIGSNRMEQPITFANCSVRQQTTYGAKRIQAIRVGDKILFVDSVGRKVRELVYNGDKYIALDLTELAEHITLTGITDWAYQKNPDSILWCVLTDGSLIAMTYEREQKVIAWHRHPIDGDVWSVCVTPSTAEDVVTLVVFREIIGDTITYIATVDETDADEETVTYEGETVYLTEYSVFVEQMAPRNYGTDLEDAYFVDCGITFTSETATTTVTGLTHLIGETVSILADGVVQADKVVDADGEVTLDTAASVVQIGLSFRSRLEPLKPVLEARMGSSAASIIEAKEMGISVFNTDGIESGTSDSNLQTVNFDDERWKNLADDDTTLISGLFTGTVAVSTGGGFSLEAPLIISTDAPLPATIRALIPKVNQTGR